jgi:CheY-like chemotaxis protein
MQNTGDSTAATASRAGGIQVLIADDDPRVRSLFETLLQQIDGVGAVVGADDGEMAVEAARELHIDVAILDLNMPRLDGVQAARLLLTRQPSMGIVVHSSDPDGLRARAADLDVQLFDKLEFDALVEWVRHQAQRPRGERSSGMRHPRRELVCSLCGYGIVSSSSPPQCPMCHAAATWIEPQRTRHALSNYVDRRAA